MIPQRTYQTGIQKITVPGKQIADVPEIVYFHSFMLYVQILLPGALIYSVTGKDRDIMTSFGQRFGEIIGDINRPAIGECRIECRI